MNDNRLRLLSDCNSLTESQVVTDRFDFHFKMSKGIRNLKQSQWLILKKKQVSSKRFVVALTIIQLIEFI